MEPFDLVGAVYLTSATGARAVTLEDLRRCVAEAGPASLFHHTQRRRLGAGDDEAPADELSAWVRGVVQDAETAERIGYAVQSAPPGPEPLRERVLEALDAVPAAARERRAAPEGGALALLAARPVPVAAGLRAEDAEGLARALEQATRDVWFHHLVEEPWFRSGQGPLLEWLRAAGGGAFAAVLAREVRRRFSIDAVRAAVRRNRRRSAITSRVLSGEAASPTETRELARRLARRLAHEGGEDA